MKRHLRFLILGVISLVFSIEARSQPIESNPADSVTDNSAIRRLSAEIKTKNELANLWNNTYLWLIAVTALVGLFTVFAQFKTLQAQRAESAKQDQLIKEKEIQVSKDLRDKDVQLAQMKLDLAGADERAGVANRKAAEARERAEEIAADNTRLKSAMETSTEEARIRAESLRQQNLATETRLEEEKRGRVELEISLLPREFSNQMWTVGVLQKFPPMTARFEFKDETEPRETAKQINFVLLEANWQTSRSIPAYPPSDGVRVSFGRAGMMVSGKYSQSFHDTELKSRAVAYTLIEELNKAGIPSQFSVEVGDDSPPSTLIISVGAKANPVLERWKERRYQDLRPRQGISVHGQRAGFK